MSLWHKSIRKLPSDLSSTLSGEDWNEENWNELAGDLMVPGPGYVRACKAGSIENWLPHEFYDK